MHTSPKDQAALLWNAKRPAPRQPKPGELLFEFRRASDGALMRVELRNHGSYGWEAQFLDRGVLSHAHGGFATRELAVQWAAQQRPVIERA